MENIPTHIIENSEDLKKLKERVDNLVRSEKKHLRTTFYVNTLLNSASRALSPIMGRSFWGLSGYAITGHGSDYLMNELSNKRAQTYRELEKSFASSFIQEAHTSMPEIEQEAKNKSFLSSSINRMSVNAVTYVDAGLSFETGIITATLSIAFLSTLATPVLIATPILGAISFVTSKYFGNKQRKEMRPARMSVNEAANASRQAQDAALSNTALNINTTSGQLAQNRLKIAHKEETTAWKKHLSIISKFLKGNTASAFFINAVAVGTAYFSGLGILGMSGTFVGASILNGSISRIVLSYYHRKEITEELYDQYNKFRHRSIYDLQYGNQKALEKSNALCLDNICYHHRYIGKEIEKNGERLPTPVLLSDKKITLHSGITLLGGASGAGKTTLYKLIRHADDLSGGSISLGKINESGHFEGSSLTSLEKGEPNHLIAFCLQEIEDDGRSALDLIRVANPHMPLEGIESVAKRLNLSLYKESTQKDQITTENEIPPKEEKSIKDLSGGEKKRVLFLQTLLSPKPILIFDEPTSGVDPTTAREMIQLLNEEKRTVIYTTHNPNELKDLNAYQAIDLAPIQDIEKVKSLKDEHGENTPIPSGIKVYSLDTQENKQIYIELATHRHKKQPDEQDTSYAPDMISKLLSLAAANAALEAEKNKETCLTPKKEKSGFFAKISLHTSQALTHFSTYASAFLTPQTQLIKYHKSSNRAKKQPSKNNNERQ